MISSKVIAKIAIVVLIPLVPGNGCRLTPNAIDKDSAATGAQSPRTTQAAATKKGLAVNIRIGMTHAAFIQEIEKHRWSGPYQHLPYDGGGGVEVYMPGGNSRDALVAEIWLVKGVEVVHRFAFTKTRNDEPISDERLGELLGWGEE